MSNLVIELPEEMRTYVDRKVTEGAFSNVSELFQDLLARAMESEIPKTGLENLLLDALVEEEQGLGRVYTDRDFDEMKLAHRKRIKDQTPHGRV